MTKRSAGFVIFKRNSDKVQYLLLQASNEEHDWSPPKGHVEPGESDMITALRETMEESGLLGKDLEIYQDSTKILNYQVKGIPKVVVYWLAELVNLNAKVQLSHEHQDYKWLSIQDACRYGKYPTLQGMLTYFDDHIQSNLCKPNS